MFLPDNTIPYIKLNLTGQITNNDIIANANIPHTKLLLTNTINNA